MFLCSSISFLGERNHQILRMAFPFITCKTVIKFCLLFLILISFLLSLSHGDEAANKQNPIQVPKGWSMPTKQNPLKIGVPGRTSFQKFVKVNNSGILDNSKFGGWCIDVFEEVRTKLNYSLPYKFIPLNGTYEDLVDCLYNKVTTLDLPFGFLNLFINFHAFHTCMTQNKQTPPLISQLDYMFIYIYEHPKNFPHCLYSPSKKFLWIY